MALFQFYTTSGCHLCEQAESMLTALLSFHPHSVEAVDIAEGDALVELYGLRIPVLRRDSDGAELGWPFTSSELEAFLIDKPDEEAC